MTTPDKNLCARDISTGDTVLRITRAARNVRTGNKTKKEIDSMSRKNNHRTSNVFGPKSWVIVKAGHSPDSKKYAGQCVQIEEIHSLRPCSFHVEHLYFTGYSSTPESEDGIWLDEIERLATQEEIAVAKWERFKKRLLNASSADLAHVRDMGMCKYTSASIARKNQFDDCNACSPRDGILPPPHVAPDHIRKFPKGAKVRVIADPEIEFTADEAIVKDTHYDDFVIRDVIYWTGKGRTAVGYSEAELELVPPKKPWPLGKKSSPVFVRDSVDEIWEMRQFFGVRHGNKYCFCARTPRGSRFTDFAYAAPFTRQNFNRLRKNLKAELRGVQTRETIKQYEIPDDLLMK